MTDNIIPFTGVTTLDLEPNKILEAAKEQDLDEVIILGIQKDGEIYIAGSTSDIGKVNLIIDRSKKLIVDM